MSSGILPHYKLGFNVHFRDAQDPINFEVECPEKLMLFLTGAELKGVVFFQGAKTNGVECAMRTSKGRIHFNIDASPELAAKLLKQPLTGCQTYIKARTVSVRPERIEHAN